MRLFVAIDLHDAARRAIAAEQSRLKEIVGSSGRTAPRWARPDQMHVTLAFLGEIDEVRGAVAVDAMRADVEAAPFTIVFAGLGVFPPRGVPSVLWLGVGAGHEEAVALQRRIVDRLLPIGVALEDRAYHPHLTLARWRAARRADRQRVLAADRGEEITRVEVAAVTLYQSHLSSHGPSYAALARAELRPMKQNPEPNEERGTPL